MVQGAVLGKDKGKKRKADDLAAEMVADAGEEDDDIDEIPTPPAPSPRSGLTGHGVGQRNGNGLVGFLHAIAFYPFYFVFA